ncbi:MAG: glycosyltransferase 87 family protein [Bifidobacteriaceae bacterium]|jgi:hypothetical protein|nr:glycosyltransferase 87 family protein [Bifidobacteriaceae bacterium]
MAEPAAGRPALALAAAVFAITLGTRLAAGLASGGLFGIGASYDEWVHYSAADMVLHGAMPYRDFSLLHPPGIAVVLSPFAWIGSLAGDHVGVILARTAAMSLNAAAAAGLAWTLRRLGRIPALAAGLWWAFRGIEVRIDSQIQLESFYNALIVGAVVAGSGLAARRKGVGGAVLALAAGGLLGLACSIKLVAFGPAAVVLALIALSAGRAAAAKALAAAAGIWLAVVAPFAAQAPRGAFNQVVRAQIGRAANDAAPRNHLGFSSHLPLTPRLALVVAVTLGLVAIVLAVGQRRGELGFAWWWLAVGTAALGELLIAPSYFSDYSIILTAPLGAAIAVSAAWLLNDFKRHFRTMALAGASLGLTTAISGLPLGPVDRGDFMAAEMVGHRDLAEALPAGTCVWGVRSSYAIMADALSPGLARGCPVIVDPTGLNQLAQAGLPFPEGEALGADQPWEVIMDRLARADVAVVDRKRDRRLAKFLAQNGGSKVDAPRLAAKLGRVQFWQLHRP